MLYIENGRKTKSEIKNNFQLIENKRQNNILNEKIQGLKDTLLFYLNNSINWKKIDKSKTIWCDDNYILFYNNKGKLKDVRLYLEHHDLITIKDKLFFFRMNKRCSSKIKKSLKKFSLEYLKPHDSFMVRIDLRYGKELEIENCWRFYNFSSKEINKCIEKQIATE